MAAPMLSQHSSNPLEVPSSDPRNKSYRRQYQEAQARRGPVASATSEDPLNTTNAEEIQGYQSHLAQLFPNRHQPSHANTTTKPPKSILKKFDKVQRQLVTRDRDEDDAMESEEDGDGDIAMEDDDGEYDEEDDPDGIGSTDEEMTIHSKPQGERDDILSEINELEEVVPQLAEDYKLIDRLGTGTFSSVYKAIDLGYHSKWDNTAWHGHHPSSSSAYYQSVPKPEDTKAFVAVKRIYVTSNPERIRNEIAILEDCRGCRHISQLITAFRHQDQVVAIMPYHRNDDFRDYYHDISMPCIKSYFRCLFRALRDVHSRGIIHRDVKPANFLFDPRTGIGTLCDFGLACRMEPGGPGSGTCLHTPTLTEYPHGRVRGRQEYDMEFIKGMQKEARNKSLLSSDRVGYPEKDTRPHSKANRAGTRGFRAPEVLLKCGDQTGAIDVWSSGMILLFFLTGKFPLFQSNDDIEALMEISTIIGRKRMEKVATLHNRTFATNVPAINQDGISWRTFVEKQNPDLFTPPEPNPHHFPYSTESRHSASAYPPASSSLGDPSRSLSPVPHFSSSSMGNGGHDDVVMNGWGTTPAGMGMDGELIPPSAKRHRQDVNLAFDLLEGLLHPECTRRITPRTALYHPFLAGGSFKAYKNSFGDRARRNSNGNTSKQTGDELKDEDEDEEDEEDEKEVEDDEFFPHPFGEGICGSLHFIDEVTEERCVRVSTTGAASSKRGGNNREGNVEEVFRVSAGEGIAIGRMPCEFHMEEFGHAPEEFFVSAY